MNQRFRNLVGSKRKPSNNLATSQSNNSLNSAPATLHTSNGSVTSSAPTSSNSNTTSAATVAATTAAAANTSPSSSSSLGVARLSGNRSPGGGGLPSPPIGGPGSQGQQLGQLGGQLPAAVAAAPNVSSTSLVMNPNHNQYPSARPPSYQHANSGIGNLNAPPPHMQQTRSTSPMPPPINTGYGHMPPHQQQMYAQQQHQLLQQQQAQAPHPGPPGYPMQQQQPQSYGYQAPNMLGQPAHYNRGYGDVEGAGQRSKAQLIVGIDFVSLVMFDIVVFATRVVVKYIHLPLTSGTQLKYDAR